jgi:hypothetical protein
MAAIIVSGALANKPGNGGAAWTRLSWILGFRRLGHDVYFVEQIDPASCRDANGDPCALGASVNAGFFARAVEAFDLRERAALLSQTDDASIGMPRAEVAAIARGADLLINISGHLTLPEVKPLVRTRVFVDLDPGYTQFWHQQGLALERLEGHDVFYTVGENIGKSGCSIPSGGIAWRPIRQPVVLDQWPALAPPARPRFTTIASWRGPYGRVSDGRVHFGLKAHEFRKFASLPRDVAWPMEIALDAHTADSPDIDMLSQHGWTIVDPVTVVPDPCSFRRYVQESAAEFSVAQGIYVATNSGWFSDRTVRYLASGRPALVQDTGFSRQYPVGTGLIAFRTPAEAAAGARAIAEDYDRHSAAARAIAVRFFDSDRVLTGLLTGLLSDIDRRA